jgi:putative ABC transport system permease protein
MSSIILGVAALVSIRSFGDNLQEAVDDQAKTLLGADLEIRSRGPFTEEMEDLFRSIGGLQSRVTSFSSMAFFPNQDQTRLSQIRAIEGSFPFYGEIETDPPEASKAFREGAFALVDNTLMLQFGCKVGDPIRIGSTEFQIAGRILDIPGEGAAITEFAPRIYIPAEFLEATGLIQMGSRIRYAIYFRLGEEEDPDELVEEMRETLRALDLSADTVSERREEIGRGLKNLNRFLMLVGFIALALGGIGVASSIHLYIKQRIASVAVLRCLGARPGASLRIYLVQAFSMGLIGAAMGALLGIILQGLIPWILSDVLPVDIQQAISWSAVVQGLLVGTAVAALFAMIPLLAIRKVSPLLALRADFETSRKKRLDRMTVLVYGLLASGLFFASYSTAGRWLVAAGFFFGLVIVFSLLYGVGLAIIKLTRRFFPSGWQYEWRQGLANLYRPHNQTVILMLSLGLGSFFVATLHLVQVSLLEEVTSLGSEDRPNLVFFDIQSDQKEQIRELVEEKGLPVILDVPVVTMRLSAINDRPVREIRDEEGRRNRWALRREYRSTYRSTLFDTEKILEGTFQPVAGSDIRVSLEKGVSEALEVGIGDRLTFDVQGLPVEVIVGSLREVEWESFQPNFFVVFPKGVLEEAPQFHVLVTRTDESEMSAEVQRLIIRDFPNVSAIDLTLVLRTIDGILDKVNFVVRFMALFSIITGLVVLTGAVVSGRYQRMKESVLLRTLGASRMQIFRILSIEYFFLGTFAALTGLILSLAASWALTRFLFETDFVPDPIALAIVIVGVVSLTVSVGLVNSKGVLDHPPLEILRNEE